MTNPIDPFMQIMFIVVMVGGIATVFKKLANSAIIRLNGFVLTFFLGLLFIVVPVYEVGFPLMVSSVHWVL